MGPRYRALSHVSMPCSANARVAASDWSRLFHKDMIFWAHAYYPEHQKGVKY